MVRERTSWGANFSDNTKTIHQMVQGVQKWCFLPDGVRASKWIENRCSNSTHSNITTVQMFTGHCSGRRGRERPRTTASEVKLAPNWYNEVAALCQSCNFIHSHIVETLVSVHQGCPTRGPHAAREVVSSGPRCDKFVSRLFKFLVYFIGTCIFANKTHHNYNCFSAMGLPPKNLYNKRFENMSII